MRCVGTGESMRAAAQNEASRLTMGDVLGGACGLEALLRANAHHPILAGRPLHEDDLERAKCEHSHRVSAHQASPSQYLTSMWQG